MTMIKMSLTVSEFLQQWDIALKYGWRLVPDEHHENHFNATPPEHFTGRKNNWASTFHMFNIGGIFVIAPQYMWDPKTVTNKK